MDAKLSLHSSRRRRSRAIRPWTLATLALLLAVGTLIQACSDNNGTTGPTFSCNENPLGEGTRSGNVRALAACTGGTQGPAPVVGNVGAGETVTVSINPGVIDIGRRGSVVVIVTSVNGAGIPGRTVRLDSLGGNLDATSGTTDASGVFATTMIVPCGTLAGGAGLVTAIVDGKTGNQIFLAQPAAPGNDPCA
jgi:hypothetical protein